MEHAELLIGPGGLTARSVAIGTSPVPYRLDLDLAVDDGWVTRRLALTAVGDGWSRSLVLDRDVDGSWRGTSTEAGAPPPAVDGAGPADVVEPDEIPGGVLDVDVQWSPLTNVMPIRRLGLTSAGIEGRFTMAWVAVPSLAVTLDEQRYTLLGVDDGAPDSRAATGCSPPYCAATPTALRSTIRASLVVCADRAGVRKRRRISGRAASCTAGAKAFATALQIRQFGQGCFGGAGMSRSRMRGSAGQASNSTSRGT